MNAKPPKKSVPKADDAKQVSNGETAPIVAEQEARYGTASDKVHDDPVMHRVVALESQRDYLATKADLAETNGRIDKLAGDVARVELNQEKWCRNKRR